MGDRLANALRSGGLGAFAFASVFWSSHVVRPNLTIAVAMLGAGSVAFCMAHAEPGERRRSSTGHIGFIVLGVLLLLGGTEVWCVAGVLGVLAGLGGLVAGSHPLASAAGRLSLLTAGLILQASLDWTLARVWANGTVVPGVADVSACLLRLLGVDAAAGDGSVLLYSMGRLQEIATSVEHLELRPVVLAVVFFALCKLLWTGGGSGIVLGYIARVIVWVLFRFVLMVLLYSLSIDFTPRAGPIGNISIFLDRNLALITLLPLLALPWSRELCRDSTAWGTANVRLVTVCTIVLGILIGNTVGPAVVRPGAARPLIIDVGHSDWEQVDRRMDTEWYGRASTYNYGVLVDYLGNRYDVQLRKERFITGTLSSNAVLLLKTPTRPFEPEEIDEIRRFVHAGGGLLLIGDHTNVFGSSAFSNAVSAPMGLSFRFDALLDSETSFVVRHESTGIWRHPICVPIRDLMLMTGCSVEVTGRAEWTQPMLGGHLKSQDLDYAQNNFFPPVEDDPGMPLGAFYLCGAASYGNGRVVAFGDSTVFSNFGICLPGRRELLIGATQWLGSERLIGTVPRSWLAILAVCASAALAWLGRRTPRTYVLGVFVVATLVTGGSICLRGLANEHLFAWPAERVKELEVEFCGENLDWELPTADYARMPARSYQLASEWSLRLGYLYRVARDPDDLDLRGAAVVLGGASGTVSERTRERLSAFIRRGGHALFCLDRGGAGGWGSFLAGVGLSAGPRIENASVVRDPGGSNRWPIRTACRVNGGTALLEVGDGVSVLSSTSLGRGQVAVCGLGREFADDRMGLTDVSEPSPDLRHHFSLWYAILSGAATGDWREKFSNLR